VTSFYKPDRNPGWNYDGQHFRLSRSKIDLFLECGRCFYLDQKLGTARPPGFPFNLNSAVDELLKKEFDVHRVEGTIHPLAKAYGVDAVPFVHDKIEEWRDALKHGIQYVHPTTGMTVRGGIDDVWKDSDGSLIIVDYKATSKKGEVSLDAEWQDGYKRQVEVYQWLFRKNGYTVSPTAYFVYANGLTDKAAFDGKLEFDVKLIPYTGDDSWIEPVLVRIKETLDGDVVPESSPECDYCTYRQYAGAKLMKAGAKPGKKR